MLESGYRLMWMMVMFDLPVCSERERKQATKFRNFLLELGFEMCQFSVYMRFCGTRDKVEKYVRQVKENVPKSGKVTMLFFTDKQFSDIINIEKRAINILKEKPSQFSLF